MKTSMKYGVGWAIVLILLTITIIATFWQSDQSRKVQFIQYVQSANGEKMIECVPVDVHRTGAYDDRGADGHGIHITLSSGKNWVFTGIHAFHAEYGGDAYYEVVSSADKKHIGWLNETISPNDLEVETPYKPDVVICSVGEKAIISPIRHSNEAPKLHQGFLPIDPTEFVSIDGTKKYKIVGVCDWESRFPIFVGEGESRPGDSGTGYSETRKGGLFLLSGDVEGFVLFTPCNPTEIKK